MKRIFIVLLPILVLILSACSGTADKTNTTSSNINANSTESMTNSLEKTDMQGAVTVAVTPRNLDNPGDVLVFEVSLQTHSVDLVMDVGALSTLKTDTGILVKALSWDGQKGGHHVAGKLSFPANQDGSPILQGAKTITVTIQDVDAPERAFTWDVTK